MDVWPSEESAAASGTVRPSFSIVGRCSDDSRFAILIGLASLALGDSALLSNPPRFGYSRVQMTFIEAMRTQFARVEANARQHPKVGRRNFGRDCVQFG
jgi:hypothetical protein